MTTISEISDTFIFDLATLDPITAVRALGFDRNGSGMSDYSPDGVDARRELYARTARAARATEPLDDRERRGREFLLTLTEGELGILDARERDRQVSILNAPPVWIRLSFDLANPKSPEHCDALMLRLGSVAPALAGYRVTLARGLDDGVVASRRSVEAVLAQIDAWTTPGHGALRTFARTLRGATSPELAETAGERADIAYRQLATWLRTTYLPAATEDDGVGRERHQVWARSLLGADLDLDEVYAWGWDQLATLQADQAATAAEVVAGASFAEARELLETDPAHAVAGVDAWRRWLQEVTDRAIADLDGRHFDVPEQLRRCVVTIPPEGGAAAPYYTCPTEDMSEPGRIWFPTVGATVFPTWDAVSTVYHEAVPGHHLERGGARLLDLTRAQRLLGNGGHLEGWALYAERLMDELGYFSDPKFRLGYLSAQAFRAARIVIDLGLHTGRRIPAGWPHAGETWTFETAVEYLRTASGRSTEFCESEIQRYLSWPAQALCYKLGERTWLDGRAGAQARAGGAFNLKEWHRRALAIGPLGLDDLARELATL